MLNRRFTIPLLLFVLFFVAAIVLRVNLVNWSPINSYANQIQSHIQVQQAALSSLMNDEETLEQLLFDGQEKSQAVRSRLQKRIETLRIKPYSLYIYQGDKLYFWSDNTVLPDIDKFEDRNTILRQSNIGQHLISMRSSQLPSGKYQLYGYIPVRYDYDLQSNNLRTRFAAGSGIPTDLEIGLDESPFPIDDIDGNTLFYIQPSQVTDRNLLIFTLLFFILAFLSLSIVIHKHAKLLYHDHGPWLGAGFLILSIGIIRFLTIILDASEVYDSLPIFNESFNIPFNRSLGDFLINLLLLLWVMFFLLRHNTLRANQDTPIWQRLLLGLSAYTLIAYWMLFISASIKLLVVNTSLNFRAESVFEYDLSAWLTIIGMMLLMASLYMFGHRHVSNVFQLQIPVKYRVPLMLSAVLSIWLVNPLINQHILLPSWALMLFAGLYLIAFDQFEHRMKSGVIWLVFWTAMLSVLPAYLLYHYNAEKEKAAQPAIAIALTQQTDSLAESEIINFLNQLSTDKELTEELTGITDLSFDKREIHERIEYYFSIDNYLHYNYRFSEHIYPMLSQYVLNSNTPDPNGGGLGVTRKLRQITEGLYIGRDIDNTPIYVSQTIFKTDATVASLIISYRRSRRERSNVYNELLMDIPYKGQAQLRNYSFERYDDQNNLIDSEGRINISDKKLSQLKANRLTQISQVKSLRTMGYKNTATNITAVWQVPMQGLNKLVEYYCSFFSIFIVTLFMLALINTRLKLLPQSLDISLGGKPSLSKKFQFAIFGLTLFFFLLISYVTATFFRNSTARYHEDRLDRKTLSVINDAKHELEMMDANSQTDINEYTNIIKPLSYIHRLDVNLFDLNGDLIRSSEEDFFAKGLQNRRMNPAAYFAMHYSGTESHSSNEFIGELEYKTSYAPLEIRNSEGNKITVAYLSLPYYSNRRQLLNDVNQFMSNLLWVYVICIILAVIISIGITNMITKGLVQVSERLRQFRLDGPNERLQIKSKDELGQLVQVYNTMVEELEKSAQKLAQSEREGAWREMAKQVAHEIKNPLTPMKLRIQHLMHAYNTDPERAGQMLENTTETLIEQIDNLARIASEFSAFAHMPQPNSSNIVINSLVTSVHSLYKQNEKGILFELQLPDEDLHVFADRQLLMSVFTNLVKNAIEAIAPTRQGFIRIILSRNEGKAILEIRDNGNGIPEELQDKVFQPNFTTKGSGTGLGLSICRKIIRTFAGNIYFKTSRHIGTSFYVELPLVDEKNSRGRRIREVDELDK